MFSARTKLIAIALMASLFVTNVYGIPIINNIVNVFIDLGEVIAVLKQILSVNTVIKENTWKIFSILDLIERKYLAGRRIVHEIRRTKGKDPQVILSSISEATDYRVPELRELERLISRHPEGLPGFPEVQKIAGRVPGAQSSDPRKPPILKGQVLNEAEAARALSYAGELREQAEATDQEAKRVIELASREDPDAKAIWLNQLGAQGAHLQAQAQTQRALAQLIELESSRMVVEQAKANTELEARLKKWRDLSDLLLKMKIYNGP